MDEYYRTYVFSRDWTLVEETLGILKYYYPNMPYTAILSALYYADIQSFTKYGYTLTCGDTLSLDDSLTNDEYFKNIFYLKNKIPTPIDILKTINYREITPISEDDQQDTSDADRKILLETMNNDLQDVTVTKHKKL